jgi:hypothetical protein
VSLEFWNFRHPVGPVKKCQCHLHVASIWSTRGTTARVTRGSSYSDVEGDRWKYGDDVALKSGS